MITKINMAQAADRAHGISDFEFGMDDLIFYVDSHK